MANGGQRRTRSSAPAAGIAPGTLGAGLAGPLASRHVVAVALALLAAVAVCAIIQAWDPPLHWRTGMVPTRYVTARVEFKKEDREETEQARLKAREETKAIFTQDTSRWNNCGPIPEYGRGTYQDRNADRKDRPALEGIPNAGGKRPPGKRQKPPRRKWPHSGIPQGPGRQGKPRSTRSRRGRGLRSASEECGLLADLTGNLNGFNQKTISVYSVEKPYSVEHPSPRRH